jgi:LPXTG-motif cell wall-anchored protein
LDEQKQQVGTIQSSDENGQVTFSQLKAGNYQLVEIEPLTGYQAIKPIQITIEANPQGELTVTSPENWTAKVVNKKITDDTNPSSSSQDKPATTGQMPKAGERPQTWLLLMGLLLIIFAGSLYYTKKNKSSK